MLALTTGLLALSLVAPPAPEAPGGYWRLGERVEPEPKDGREALFIGTLLTGVGALRAGSAVGGLLAAGDQCASFDRLGISLDAAACRGYRNYSWVNLGVGSAFVLTGVVYLALGAHRRSRHNAWTRGEVSLQLGPSGPWLAF